MQNFSKTRLISMLICPRRFWLELYKPDLRKDSQQTNTNYSIGYQVGEIARIIFDPNATGTLIDIEKEGFDNALLKSKLLLKRDLPIFEAGFLGSNIIAFADVMLPIKNKTAWQMIEVKSSTAIKNYHKDDIAIQTFAAKAAGIEIEKVCIAHIDRSWTYSGNREYEGLLKIHDLSDEAFARNNEVADWVNQAISIANSNLEPNKSIGEQCQIPFDCGFISHCSKEQRTAEFPIKWLPRITSKKLLEFQSDGIHDLRMVPDEKLNNIQLRVKNTSITGDTYFDKQGCHKELQKYPLPCHFLDFESIQFGVPIWKDTKPYQQVCFQFSLHTLKENGQLMHSEFIDLSGEDPNKKFAQALISKCGNDSNTIFVYNSSFEKSRIAELAQKFPDLAAILNEINNRIVDLLPIAKSYFYHPSQEGSWSIKKLLRVIDPDNSYDSLDGVKDGNMAIDAYREAINEKTLQERKNELKNQLLKYCHLDTLALFKLWEKFKSI